jgi:nitrogen fixation-related uncharacterized protein
MTEYWFARRFPVGQTRNSLSPINENGWAVVRTYLAFMVGGAVVAVLLAVVGLLWVPFLWILAPFAFIGATAYGGYYFISQAQAHGDTQHSIDDYRGGNIPPAAPSVGASSPYAPGDKPGRPPSIHAHFAERDGYWFARYRVNPEGRGLVAVSWQGYAVIVGFILSFVLGGLCWLLLAFVGHALILGVVVFAVFAVIGGSTFIWAAATKSDPKRTVADYQAASSK